VETSTAVDVANVDGEGNVGVEVIVDVEVIVGVEVRESDVSCAWYRMVEYDVYAGVLSLG
jgi:hypothetical protein